ncbi:hypothetical protein ACFSO9_07990 [Mesonia maritima]
MSDSKYIKEALEFHEFEFGKFYFFKRFIVAEIADDVTYTWENAKEVLAVVDSIYPQDFAPYYVSNKINSYAIDPTIWVNVRRSHRKVKAYFIIEKTRMAKLNFLFEQKFFEGVIKKFPSLEDAIECIKNS